MINYLKRFLHDPTGEPSIMRLCFLITVLVLLGVWIWKNIQAPPGCMVDFVPNQRDVFIFSLAGKVLQSGTEQPGGIGGMLGAFKNAMSKKSDLPCQDS
jgi:hypothetical protein